MVQLTWDFLLYPSSNPGVNENEIECDEKEKINLSSPCKAFAVTFKVSYIDSPHK